MIILKVSVDNRDRLRGILYIKMLGILVEAILQHGILYLSVTSYATLS
jgi:hypothetical protein